MEREDAPLQYFAMESRSRLKSGIQGVASKEILTVCVVRNM